MDKTLLKGLQALEFLVRADDELRITDVAESLSLTKSNAYRILRSLEGAGYLKQNPRTKAFSPSLRIWELGTQVANRLDLRAVATDALARLADLSRETVHLAILDGAEVIYVEKIDSPEPVSAYTRLAGRAPAYCVATGKALLSHKATRDLEILLVDLHPHSPFTITDPIRLRAELSEAAKNGYAVNRGEWRESVWGVAAAILDPAGAPAAAVGVSGPSFRIHSANRVQELAVLVKAAAREISRAMGQR